MVAALDSLCETERAQQRPKVFEPDVGIRQDTEHLIQNPLAHTSIIAATAKPVKNCLIGAVGVIPGRITRLSESKQAT